MDYSNSWMWSADHLEKDSNWTSPFFKSVFCSINDSLARPQTKLAGTSIFGSLSPVEQCGILIPIFLVAIIKNLYSNKVRKQTQESIYFVVSINTYVGLKSHSNYQFLLGLSEWKE